MEKKRRFTTMMTICVLLACLSAAAPGKVIYVDDGAAGGDDGSSWANAFVRLQSAIFTARWGDEIRVAQGLYKPDPSSAATRTSMGRRGGSIELDPKTVVYPSFRLLGGVAIRGGFAGFGAEDPNTRDPQRYETILSGDLNGDDIAAWGLGHLMYEALRDDNSLHVLEDTSGNANQTAVLDGFTIQAATESAMYTMGSNPQIANCTFRQNSSMRFSGGAVRCAGGQPRFSHCVFEDNAAVIVGGAIYFTGARAMLSDCRFIHNWAMSLGGAISSTNSDLTLTGCTFTENAGQQGGAIHYQHQGNLTLTDCRFEGNMAGEQGGAINLMPQQAVSMMRCVFKENWTTRWGGALFCEGPSLLLDTCAFTGNQATWGGAIYTSSPYPLSAGPLAPGTTTAHCVFTGNYGALEGGALWAYRTGFTIDSCTFVRNSARTGATLGWPAVESNETICRIAMENCIVWDGKGSISVGQLGHRPVAGYEEGKGEVVVRYSDVQGGWPGAGNIDADPLFASLGYWADASNPEVAVEPTYPNAIWIDGDCHLKSQAGRWDPASESWVPDEVTSPCIDAGDPNAPVGDEPERNGGRINLGAYGGTVEASKSL